MSFIVSDPIPQPRQRHAIRNGKVVNYTPRTHKVVNFKKEIAARALAARPSQWPLDKAYTLSLVFYLKSHSAVDVAHTGKPDLDNLEKSVMDSLIHVVYNDDCQVFSKKSMKLTSEISFVEITIEYIDE